VEGDQRVGKKVADVIFERQWCKAKEMYVPLQLVGRLYHVVLKCMRFVYANIQ